MKQTYICIMLFVIVFISGCSFFDSDTTEKKPQKKIERVESQDEPTQQEATAKPVYENNYPPDSQPFERAYKKDGLAMYKFPEYKERVRFSATGYGLIDEKSKQALIIDPGIGSVRMIHYWLKKFELNLVGIVTTHGHLDHTGGISVLKKTFPEAKFYAPEKDAKWMRENDPLNFFGIKAELPPEPDVTVKDGDLIEFGSQVIDVIETPGHTVGSVCLSMPDHKLLFSGDTLFYRSIGRTKFKHSLSFVEEISSIKQKLTSLADNTLVFPGHGSPTILGDERKHNPYLTGVSLPAGRNHAIKK